MILPRPVFYGLLAVPALLPLVLLGRLWLAPVTVPALRTASLGFFLCAVAMIVVWLLTDGQTSPPLESMGLGLLFKSTLAAGASCLLSVVCGLFCLGTRPWVLLWLVPAVLLLAALSAATWRVFH